MNKITFLSQSDITSIVQVTGIDALMDELIDRLHQAFIDYDPVQTLIPVRDGFSYLEPHPGLLEWMPLLNSGSQMLMKLVGYHPQNPDLNKLPTILSNFSVYSATTGQLESILDGTFLTALRTGAASAVASRLLGNPESSVVGIVGCGAQSITQLHGLSRVFDLKRVLFYDVDAATRASFRERCNFLGDEVQFIDSSLRETVSEVDLLCVATSIDIGGGPVFEDMETMPHLHINAVGSDFPGKTELPLELLSRSFISPDSRAQAIEEGECQQIDPNLIGGELHELLRSGPEAVLQNAVTIFDSTGWSLEDYTVTKLILELAEQLGIGQQLESEDATSDPKNPYSDLNIQKAVFVNYRAG